ncbi:hypothetical protein BU16DRAFT_561719 [Lophium mytilinum]|uniref:Uncharacterized protein n=1 Tax=Lophium mytilinum TaxID=390894 RepID=A0A6A6QTD1_9PEZI|nr:hypothetical protein BU16DRAFT_561719 [Lophium mytilinum]
MAGENCVSMPSIQRLSTPEFATLSPESTTLSPGSARYSSGSPEAVKSTKKRLRETASPFDESEEDFSGPKRFCSLEGLPAWITEDVSNDEMTDANCEVTVVEYHLGSIEERVMVMDGGAPYIPAKDAQQTSSNHDAPETERWLHRDEDTKEAWAEALMQVLSPDEPDSDEEESWSESETSDESIPYWDPFQHDIWEVRERTEVPALKPPELPSLEEWRAMEGMGFDSADSDQEAQEARNEAEETASVCGVCEEGAWERGEGLIREEGEKSAWEQDAVPSEEELGDLMMADLIIPNYPDANQEEAWRNLKILDACSICGQSCSPIVCEGFANGAISEEGERLVHEQDTVPSEEERKAIMDALVPEYPDMDQEEAFYECHADKGS